MELDVRNNELGLLLNLELFCQMAREVACYY